MHHSMDLFTTWRGRSLHWCLIAMGISGVLADEGAWAQTVVRQDSARAPLLADPPRRQASGGALAPRGQAAGNSRALASELVPEPAPATMSPGRAQPRRRPPPVSGRISDDPAAVALRPHLAPAVSTARQVPPPANLNEPLLLPDDTVWPDARPPAQPSRTAGLRAGAGPLDRRQKRVKRAQWVKRAKGEPQGGVAGTTRPQPSKMAADRAPWRRDPLVAGTRRARAEQGPMRATRRSVAATPRLALRPARSPRPAARAQREQGARTVSAPPQHVAVLKGQRAGPPARPRVRPASKAATATSSPNKPALRVSKRVSTNKASVLRASASRGKAASARPQTRPATPAG